MWTVKTISLFDVWFDEQDEATQEKVLALNFFFALIFGFSSAFFFARNFLSHAGIPALRMVIRDNLCHCPGAAYPFFSSWIMIVFMVHSASLTFL